VPRLPGLLARCFSGDGLTESRQALTWNEHLRARSPDLGDRRYRPTPVIVDSSI